MWVEKSCTNLVLIFVVYSVFIAKNVKRCIFLWFIKDKVVDLGAFLNF